MTVSVDMVEELLASPDRADWSKTTIQEDAPSFVELRWRPR
jgi:hypothetical protein